MRCLVFVALLTACAATPTATAPAAPKTSAAPPAALRPLDEQHGSDFVTAFDGAKAKTRILAAFSTT